MNRKKIKLIMKIYFFKSMETKVHRNITTLPVRTQSVYKRKVKPVKIVN